jgi:CheY-like chemotaxis protein
VAITVTDTGTGMDDEVQRHLFEPFFTTKESGKGTGLGLATAYGIVKQSGGYIWVDSAPGHGTSVGIHLPLVSEAARPYQHDDATVCTPGGSETILLVEDHDAGRLYARRVLENLGYRVVVAADGPAALAGAAEVAGPIHLLLTDVVMPGMSGRALAGRLAETRPETRVLYASGYAEDSIGRRDGDGPEAPLLSKPFTPAALAQKVRAILDA